MKDFNCKTNGQPAFSPDICGYKESLEKYFPWGIYYYYSSDLIGYS